MGIWELGSELNMTQKKDDDGHGSIKYDKFLTSLTKKWRRQMASTLKPVDNSREEVGALHDCLVVSDVVRDEQVAAALQR